MRAGGIGVLSKAHFDMEQVSLVSRSNEVESVELQQTRSAENASTEETLQGETGAPGLGIGALLGGRRPLLSLSVPSFFRPL